MLALKLFFTMTIIDQLIQTIDAETQKATAEMNRSSQAFNQAEMNFWQGEMIAYQKCKHWILTLFGHELQTKKERI